MQITIELPNDFVAFKAVPEIKQEIKTSYALWLFQHEHERVTLVNSAELAGVDLYDFMSTFTDKWRTRQLLQALPCIFCIKTTFKGQCHVCD